MTKYKLTLGFSIDPLAAFLWRFILGCGGLDFCFVQYPKPTVTLSVFLLSTSMGRKISSMGKLNSQYLKVLNQIFSWVTEKNEFLHLGAKNKLRNPKKSWTLGKYVCGADSIILIKVSLLVLRRIFQGDGVWWAVRPHPHPGSGINNVKNAVM